jgi:hypothetical protein
MSLEDEDARARDDRKKRKERQEDAHELKKRPMRASR